MHSGTVSAEEFDRLAFLLRLSGERAQDDGSPMDTSPSPFEGGGPPWLLQQRAMPRRVLMHGLRRQRWRAWRPWRVGVLNAVIGRGDLDERGRRLD